MLPPFCPPFPSFRLLVGISLRNSWELGAKKVEDYQVDVVIAVTIADPLQLIQVNNQVLQKWRMRGYIPTQIEVAPRLRARFVTNNRNA